MIENAVKTSNTWSQVCIKLGLSPLSGSNSHIKVRAIKYNIDFSHFPGQAWVKGKQLGYKRSIEVYLNGKFSISSNHLRNRLIKENIKENKCELCGISEWMGKPAPLELDHINSDHFDNRLENLQILCANCHAQKPRKNQKSFKE